MIGAARIGAGRIGGRDIVACDRILGGPPSRSLDGGGATFLRGTAFFNTGAGLLGGGGLRTGGL